MFVYLKVCICICLRAGNDYIYSREHDTANTMQNISYAQVIHMAFKTILRGLQGTQATGNSSTRVEI